MLTLSRRVPARTKTLTARWCNRNFTIMCDHFRAIRARARDKMDACHWCGDQFENGEMMALVALEKGPNKVLCQGCAGKLLASEKPALAEPKGT